MTKRVVKLSVVRNQRKAAEAKSLRSDLFNSARRISSAMGDEFGGYAIVAWERNGDVYSSINNSYGPIRGRALPSFCRDAISAHVTLDIAKSPSELED